MAKTTPATLALDKAGAGYSLHAYVYDPGADSIGLHAAHSLGVDPSMVLKTLIAMVDGKPVCVIAPSDREVSMKKLAAVFRGKAAEMARVADAERITGYRVGGVSPFGQKKQLPTVLDDSALSHPRVFLNGGQRGLQVNMAPAEVARAAEAIVAAVT